MPEGGPEARARHQNPSQRDEAQSIAPSNTHDPSFASEPNSQCA
eukprot:CAMPEP_0203916116 /NCGR_PEP_ID=MMETSP0359-20131031/56812_1 /ASSEMBLY_ACC=CAM_ASM_000338 /TAXON_ID=268821 /ORGANISM="Scrippsiella Hangoei, Strain SHTV-5" /LENGTH=43 /DNA_ID= /DNA_START= /DNA_END= /DNA_ORIENTATION=